MAIRGSIRVEFGAVFPDGAYAAGPVEKVRDFDRSRGDGWSSSSTRTAACRCGWSR